MREWKCQVKIAPAPRYKAVPGDPRQFSVVTPRRFLIPEAQWEPGCRLGLYLEPHLGGVRYWMLCSWFSTGATELGLHEKVLERTETREYSALWLPDTQIRIRDLEKKWDGIWWIMGKKHLDHIGKVLSLDEQLLARLQPRRVPGAIVVTDERPEGFHMHLWASL